MTSISIAVELYKLQGQNSKNAGQKNLFLITTKIYASLSAENFNETSCLAGQ